MVDPSEPGTRECMRCSWLFVSPDPSRIRRCADCKDEEDDYEPRSARVAQMEVPIHPLLWEAV